MATKRSKTRKFKSYLHPTYADVFPEVRIEAIHLYPGNEVTIMLEQEEKESNNNIPLIIRINKNKTIEMFCDSCLDIQKIIKFKN